MKVRAEQQALAAHGLNFVMEKYLPDKIAHPEKPPAVTTVTFK